MEESSQEERNMAETGVCSAHMHRVLESYANDQGGNTLSVHIDLFSVQSAVFSVSSSVRRRKMYILEYKSTG